MDKCDNSHVYIKQGCKLVKRIVYTDNDGKKYIKLNGSNTYLQDIRGKYRYSD